MPPWVNCAGVFLQASFGVPLRGTVSPVIMVWMKKKEKRRGSDFRENVLGDLSLCGGTV
jgi:hypothetical protein